MTQAQSLWPVKIQSDSLGTHFLVHQGHLARLKADSPGIWYKIFVNGGSFMDPWCIGQWYQMGNLGFICKEERIDSEIRLFLHY